MSNDHESVCRYGRTQVVINPGTGPVRGASLEKAKENMREFCQETGATKIRRAPSCDEDGRFGFKCLSKHGTTHVIEMPGIYFKDSLLRMYVDGDSWIWQCAVEIVRDGWDE
jgi:hypothetical protein